MALVCEGEGVEEMGFKVNARTIVTEIATKIIIPNPILKLMVSLAKLFEINSIGELALTLFFLPLNAAADGFISPKDTSIAHFIMVSKLIYRYIPPLKEQ